MHARNRTWLLGSDPVERCRQRTLNVEGGDGSTLSIDFTTGVLDPRLTFTRSSNATFINSQGYVEWANSNMYWNTAFEGLTGTNPSLTSSGWGYVFSTGNAVFNGDGTVTVTTTASDRRAIFRSSGFTGNGLRVVAAVDVTIHSGSLTASQVIVTGTPTNAQHYVNGVIWNSSHPIWNGGVLPVGTSFNIAYATDSLTGSTTSMYFGVGCSSAVAGSATFSNPRWTMWKGSGTVPYYPNTSATNNSTADRYKSNDYQGPRFDYDPTALTPRGLLIEGSASNLLKYSAYADTNWIAFGGYSKSYTTNISSPANDTSAARITFSAVGHGLYTNNTQMGYTNTVGATYTMSAWIRATSNTTNLNIRFGDSAVAASPNIPITTTWTRYSYSYVAVSASGPLIQSASGTATGEFEMWGFQLEAGSGASSYIPTGASQGFRAADKMSMTDISTMQWNQTEGTFALNMDVAAETNTSSFPAFMGMYTATPVRVVRFLLNNSSGTNPRIGNDTSTATPSQILIGFVNRSATPAAFKFAVALSNTGQTINQVINAGSAITTSGTGTLQTPTRVFWHQDPSTSDPDYFPIHIRTMKYWPVALPNAQLQALTT